MPLVTAIITTFNRAHYLEKAIKSVLRQDFSDYELLILDNSSTDHTAEVIQTFQDQRIRYIKHPPLNISQTRNLGVAQAKGEFIAFLDDDDEWLPHKLRCELTLFQTVSDDVGLVYGGFQRMDTDGSVFYSHPPVLQGHILKDLLSLRDDFTGSASNPMLRKSAILALNGFDETVKTGEDWEFYLRLAERYRVRYVPDMVVNVRHHNGSRLGDRVQDYIDLEQQVMRRFAQQFAEDKKLKSFYLQRLGGKMMRLGQKQDARRFLFQSIQTNYWNWFAYAQLLSSFLGRQFYLRLHVLYLNLKRPFKVAI